MTTDFRIRAAQALSDERLRRNFRRAMDGLVAKRLDTFADAEALETLRDRGAAIRAHALDRLPELLEELERNCERNGIRVHWAETADEGNRVVLDILRRHGAGGVIKGKSMVSEEMGLNGYLERHGIEVVETDLGEFILQLAGERPSHIIAPAIHKDRADIAALFTQRFPEIPYDEDIEALASAARRLMREKFKATAAGLSGVNFAVAETGTLCLVENEGNGRMCTTAPEVHIAVTGIEKVVATLDQVPPLLTLLTGSATGQPVTTYVNWIGSPRRKGEKDGPKEVHLVLLDNGRSRIFADPRLRETLRCIRCGACMNHCPVYTRLGGHAYGTVYPGPIGSLLEPQLHSLERLGELAEASTFCGACAEVCPVRIPIPDLLRELRRQRAGPAPDSPQTRQVGRGAGRQRLLWRLWAGVYASPGRYRAFTAALTRLRRLLPRRIGPWTRTRAAPAVASRSLHRLAREEGFEPR